MALNICLTGNDLGTSADYLKSVANCLYETPVSESDIRRRALLTDLHKKAWSYSTLSKYCFWSSLGLAITVLIWPTVSPILRDQVERHKSEVPGSKTTRIALLRIGAASGLQTTLTALAALSFALYGHYKGSQGQTETLMRKVFYAETLDDDLVQTVIDNIAGIDTGFRFSLSE